MQRRVTLGAIAASSALALVTACGAQALSSSSNESSAKPKTELSQATQRLTNRSALTMTVSLRTTPAMVTLLGDAFHGGRSSGLSSAQAAAIAGARLTVEEKAPKGKTIAQAQHTPGAVAMSVAMVSGTTSYLAFRSVGSTLYLRADLKDLLSLGGAEAEYQLLQTKAASLPAFVQALVAGKWVSISLATLTTIEAFAKSMANLHLPTAAQLQQLVRTLTATMLGDVTVRRLSKGTTDQLLVTGNSRQLANNVMSVLVKALPQLGTAPLSASKPQTVPNRTVRLNASVTGGALSRITFDLGQLAPGQHVAVPLITTFSGNAGPIVAPRGATPITLAGLAGLVGGLGGLGGLGAASLHLATSPPSTVGSMR
jgi:hypothetical protein